MPLAKSTFWTGGANYTENSDCWIAGCRGEGKPRRSMEFFANQHDRLSLYRSLCAVKVLLAPQMGSTYRFALEKQLRCFDHCSRIIVRAKFVEVLARYSL
jgi:hypothetical protein